MKKIVALAALVTIVPGSLVRAETLQMPADTVEQIKKAASSVRATADDLVEQVKETAQKVSPDVTEAARDAKDVLVGVGNGQSPDSTTRLRTRQGKLYVYRAYLWSLQEDLKAAKVIEDFTEEMVGDGAMSSAKFTPVAAFSIPLAYSTVVLGWKTLKMATYKGPIDAYYFVKYGKINGEIIRDVETAKNLRNSMSTSSRIWRLGSAPVRYVAKVGTMAGVTAAVGGLTALTVYNGVAMYANEADYRNLVAENAAEIAKTDAEIAKIDARIGANQ